MNRQTNSQRAAVILCGGKSSRMGRAKADLQFGDETMLQRVTRILSQILDQIVVVAAAEQTIPRFDKISRDCVVTIARDSLEFAGPLAGMSVGLSKLAAAATPPEFAYVTSCDVPFLNPDFVQELFRQIENQTGENQIGEKNDIVVPEDETHLHPLAAVYRVRLAERMRQLIAQGQRRPRSLFDLVPTRRISTANLERHDSGLMTLVNLNSPNEYKAALEKAGLPIPSWLEGTS